MFKPTDLQIILGRRGSGKSYLGRKLQTLYPRKVIFDPMCEYTSAHGILTHDYAEFGEALVSLAEKASSDFTVILQFDLENEDPKPEFNEALRLIFLRGSVMVCIEEVQMLSTPHYLPHWFRNSIFVGRHRQIGLLMTTQRPARCHKDIISQCNHIWVGPQHEDADISYCQTVLRGVPTEEILRLPDRRFFHFQPGENSLTLVDNDLRRVLKSSAKSADN